MKKKTASLLAAAAAFALLPTSALATAPSAAQLPEGVAAAPGLTPTALEAQGWVRGSAVPGGNHADSPYVADVAAGEDSAPADEASPAQSEDVAAPSASPAPGGAGEDATIEPGDDATAQPSVDASPAPSGAPGDESAEPGEATGEESAAPTESASPSASASAEPSQSASASPSASASEESLEPDQLPVVPHLLDNGSTRDHTTTRPVGLIFIRSYGDSGSMCTGSLIGPAGSARSKWVLTARHCFVSGSDQHKFNPKNTVNVSKVTFHPTPDARGQSYGVKKVFLDPRSDLALMELTSEVPNRRPYQVAKAEPVRGSSFTAFGYGPDAQNPGPPRRNYASVTVNGYVSTPSQFCGDQTMAGTSFGMTIQGDSGGPAVMRGTEIVGVLSAGALSGFKGPKGEKLIAHPQDAGLAYWVSADAIRQFIYEQRGTLKFDFGPGKKSVDCKGNHKPISATIVSSTDYDVRWAAAVSNGDIYYYHPAGARERVRAVGKPVVMNVRICYMNAAGCITLQDSLLPSGWTQVNAADGSRNPFYAQSGVQWIRSYARTQWGHNDSAGKLPGRPANPKANIGLTRIGGASRVDTAANVYRQGGFANSSRYAVLTSGNNFADAVVSAPLAAQYGTGVLLTTSGGKLEPVVRDALSFGKVNHVFIVGSTGSVSAAKEAELRGAGIKVTRLGGADRFATSVSVGSHLKAKGANRVALLADYQSFPDALAAGAAAGQQGGFVLLTRISWSNGQWRDSTPAAVRNLAIGQRNRYAVGGKAFTAARGWSNVRAIIGNDRYETSAALVRAFASSNNVVAATGENFPDALSAGALVAKRRGALLLVPRQGISPQSRVLGRELSVNSITVVGGTSSLSDAQVKKHLR
ncbi:cell wall-binding repeat-containing protein [Buchananella felis]|uniref:cell wall-binding repeat-containing protein n=1 Tax=Buchananella felis TaxID=3231492 RepID=UPI00352973E3